jgi:hypothetical protein
MAHIKDVADDFRAATANPHDIADTLRIIARGMDDDGAELDYPDRRRAPQALSLSHSFA